jgi:hypothetical protein
MPRPKSDDPTVAVTLRIKASTLARYEALGGVWRGQMEAAIERFGLPLPSIEAPKARSPVARPHVSRLKGVWKAP